MVILLQTRLEQNLLSVGAPFCIGYWASPCIRHKVTSSHSNTSLRLTKVVLIQACSKHYPVSLTPNAKYTIPKTTFSGFLVAALDHEMVLPGFTLLCAQGLPPGPQTNIETDLPFSSTS